MQHAASLHDITMLLFQLLSLLGITSALLVFRPCWHETFHVDLH